MFKAFDPVVFDHAANAHDASPAGAVVMEVVVADNIIRHVDRRKVNQHSRFGKRFAIHINPVQRERFTGIGRIKTLGIHIQICIDILKLRNFGGMFDCMVVVSQHTHTVSGENKFAVHRAAFAAGGTDESSFFRFGFDDVHRAAVEVDGIVTDKAEFTPFDNRTFTTGGIVDGIRRNRKQTVFRCSGRTGPADGTAVFDKVFTDNLTGDDAARTGIHGQIDELQIFRHAAHLENAILTEVQHQHITRFGEVRHDIGQHAFGIGKFLIGLAAVKTGPVNHPAGLGIKIHGVFDQIRLGKFRVSVMDTVENFVCLGIDPGHGRLSVTQRIVVHRKIPQGDIFAAVEEKQGRQTGIDQYGVFTTADGQIFELFAKRDGSAFHLAVRESNITLTGFIAAADVLGKIDSSDFFCTQQHGCGSKNQHR